MTSNNSVIKLTEFSPHSDDQRTNTNIFKRLFQKTAKSTNDEVIEPTNESISNVPEVTITPTSARTASKVLHRLTQIISGSGKTYRDSDFRQYWMPDDNCHVCYDCTAKFNTVRRRHHCRICGQIFCSQCCNKQVPGPAMGFSGFLRCCNYCSEIVQQYMETNGQNGTCNSINEKISITTNTNMPQSNDSGHNFTHSRHGSLNGQSSSIFDEDIRRYNSCENLTTKNSNDYTSTLNNIPGDGNQLKNLWLALLEKLPRQNIRSRLQVVDFCFTGEDIVNSLIDNDTAKYREHALIFGQSFLDSKFILNLSNNDSIFRDSAQSFYKLNKLSDILFKSNSQEFLQKFDHKTFGSFPFMGKENNETTEVDEPLWVQKIQRHDDKNINEKIVCNIDETLQLPENIDMIDYFSQNSFQLAQNESLEYYSELPSKIISEDADSLEDASTNLIDNSFHQDLKNLQNDQITKITNKLLLKANVSLNWAPIIINFASRIAELIKPNKRLHDEMDIRNFVKIKKIPGGTSDNWKIFNGVIFSKNVANRKMRHDIKGAKILLLGCPVEYQRVENKMTSLEPLILQEDEYLKKITNRILDLEPDIVLAEKSVSRIAQNYLFEAGIALVLNVKKSIMLRLARITQATIVTSIDGLVGRTSTLGYCSSFYISTYDINNNGLRKSIMCLESENPHLACSMIIRGANFRVLKKIKKVLNFMIFASNNSRLELSYLIHEGASYNNNLFKNIDLNSFNLKSSDDINLEAILANSAKNINQYNGENHVEDEHLIELVNNLNDDSSINQLNETQIEEMTNSDIVKNEMIKFINKNEFQKILDSEIVSISPLVNLEPIYFESNLGINSQFKKYFSVPSLESMLLLNDLPENNNESDDEDVYLLNCINVKSNFFFDKHQFTNCQLNYPANSNKVQNLISDYRSFGGRLPLLNKPPVKIQPHTESKLLSVISNKEEIKEPIPLSYFNIEDHQSLSILFTSYSPQSVISPVPCVLPWIVTMEFYSSKDISLGFFLEKFCFSETYKCVNVSCDTSMIYHIRKFIHGNASIQINLKKVDAYSNDQIIFNNPVYNNSITISNQCSICKTRTSPIILSDETLRLSFSKYLQLRLYASEYTPVETSLMSSSTNQSICSHSLHIDHMQIFEYNNIRVTFKYEKIKLYEILLPPMCLHISSSIYSVDSFLSQLEKLKERAAIVFNSAEDYLDNLKLDLLLLEETFIWQYLKEFATEKNVMLQNIENFNPFIEKYRLHDAKMDYCELGTQIQDKFIEVQNSLAILAVNWNEKFLEIGSWIKKSDKTLKIPLPIQSGMTSQRSSKETSSLANEILNIPIIETSRNISSPSKQSNLNQNSTLEAMPLDETLVQDNTCFVNQLPLPVIYGHNDINFHDILRHKHVTHNRQSQEFQQLKSYINNISLQQHDITTDITQQLKNNEDSLEHSDVFFPNDHNQITAKFETNKIVCNLKKDDYEQISEIEYSDEILLDENQFIESKNKNNAIDDFKDHESKTQIIRDVKDQLFLAPNITFDEKSNEKIVKISKELIDEESSNLILHTLNDEKSKGQDSIKEELFLETKLSAEITKKIRISNRDLDVERKVNNVKSIFSSLLSGSGTNAIIFPFPANEHHLMQSLEQHKFIVYDEEPSTVIAYSLASQDYSSQLEQLTNRKEPEIETDNKKTALLSFLKTRDQSPNKQVFTAKTNPDAVKYTPRIDNASHEHSLETEKSDTEKDSKLQKSLKLAKPTQVNHHIEVQFADTSTKFYCKIFYAAQFVELRKQIFPDGEAKYINSLSHCVTWLASGGKSGSCFRKTIDDRFVLKQMSIREMQSFIEFAPHYFEYIRECNNEGRPTILAKIVGVYKIVFDNSKTQESLKQDILVMEHLFYKHDIIQKFDLKGSVRNRRASTTGKSVEEIVLLDENMLKAMVESPLYIRDHTKQILMSSISRDTAFLSRHQIMDYSLLIGVCQNDGNEDENKEGSLIIGIIDYIRTFTWDKRVEMIFKTTYSGKMPTVVSPEIYRSRFLDSMQRYFLCVPDHWHKFQPSLI